MNKFITVLLTLCISTIPLFKCICCEVSFNTTYNCCNSESSQDQQCDTHPCLDSFNGMSLSESKLFSDINFLPFNTVEVYSNTFDNKFSVGFVNPDQLGSSFRRHILLNVFLI